MAHGLWETLQAIARLAHKGCHAGTLVVPPFNGRLFSPARSPIAESCAVDDEAARRALLALSTTASGARGRRQVSRHRTHRPPNERESTIAISVSSSSALSTRAFSTTCRPSKGRDGIALFFGEAATLANRRDRFTRRKRLPTTSCAARCIRSSTAQAVTRSSAFASSTRRWEAGRFWYRPAGTSRVRTNVPSSRKGRATTPMSMNPIAPPSDASSRKGACSASI